VITTHIGSKEETVERDRQIDYAKRILVHYFRTVADYAGMPWDGDNTAEIEHAIEELVQGTVKVLLEQIQEGICLRY